MIVPDRDLVPTGVLRNRPWSKWRRGRLARELFTGRYQVGESLQLSQIAAAYDFEEEEIRRTLLELQALGWVKLSAKKTVIVCEPNPKEMQEAYEIRAGLEEIAGRTAAYAFKGNVGRLRYELAAMRAALEERFGCLRRARRALSSNHFTRFTERGASACLGHFGCRAPQASNHRKSDAEFDRGCGVSPTDHRGTRPRPRQRGRIAPTQSRGNIHAILKEGRFRLRGPTGS
jgi:Bacterial regulatory proteins, gntR family